jgi:hypothetical protein
VPKTDAIDGESKSHRRANRLSVSRSHKDGHLCWKGRMGNRERFEGIVAALSGPDMAVVKIPRTRWAYNAAMARPGEQPKVLETVVLTS